MKFLNVGLLAAASGLFVACATGHCRKNQEAAMKKAQEESMKKISVFKYDGSKQCEGGEVSLEKMAEELKPIQVFAQKKEHDGLMRVQMCGTTTGMANVYEIPESQKKLAVEKGFKDWEEFKKSTQ